MSLIITVQEAYLATHTPALQQIQHWLDTALPFIQDAPDHPEILTIRIVDPEESAQLNETFLQKPRPTNVLSFPCHTVMDDNTPILGDLALCADLVRTEANELNIPIQAHWAHLLIHGLLHLYGYDHLNDADAERMENVEINILAKLGFANPYTPTQHIKDIT